MLNNWITNTNPTLSLVDKLKELRKPINKVKMVLVQQHEIERLIPNAHLFRYTAYIEYLYDHYIVKQLPKTFLC